MEKRLGMRYAALAALSISLGLVGAIPAQQRAVPSGGPTATELTAWRRSRVHSPRPSNKGCFETNYPAASWTETNCVIPPNIPLRPYHGGVRRLDTVGDGTDFSAQIPGSSVTMEGSFDSISGVTSESGGGTANAYTLQLNSEFFSTTTCGGQSGCVGWEQFVFLNVETASRSLGFIQYWMINYGTSCPSGWQSGGGEDCYRNSVYGVAVPVQTIATLDQMTLTGVAPSGEMDDSVTVSINSKLYSVTGNAYFPDLAQNWNTSEFNVLGPGNGSQAVFNEGATMVVRTAVETGTAAPSCVSEGFTAETNNLTLISEAANQQDASWPSIVFTQSNAGGGTPATCANLSAAQTASNDNDGPVPSWALVALGAALVGIAGRGLRRS
jgi:hypothetical protein